MSLRLKYYQQFQQILTSYQVSERAKQALKELDLVLLLAPTSTGRNTIIRHLQSTGRYYYVVSDTTRPPRINDGILEQNGKEYWFRTEEEILADLKAGEFLEAELIHNQQVSGISMRELLKAKAERKIAITDIDLDGTHKVTSAKPDTTAIMFLPPSYEEWQHRIAQRGAMGQEEYQRRLETAYKIFSDGLKQDYYRFVIAENVKQSASIIDAMVKGGPNPHQDRGKALVRQLKSQLSHQLNKWS